MLSVTACKKDYTCTCTFDSTTSVPDIKLEFKKVKKDEAEDGCSSAQTTYQIADPKAACSL